ncbi:hypothetical protein BH10BAC5_BH10BAC5_04530 [soil metagenome]
MNLQKHINILSLLLFALLISSCANQQPPPGGPEDKTPPVIIKLTPRDSTTNYTGNKISFEFDEYVNRRSFEESFFISPKPSSNQKFDWSGRSVDVIFENGFDINKTYSITINRDLKDLNGGNALTAPFNFAFTTGNKIENGNISGTLFGDNFDRIIVSCYQLPDANPTVKKGDYITQPDITGNYTFRNLAPGNYRIFVIRDESRDQLFSKEIDKIAIPFQDVSLQRDSAVSGLNFLLSSPSIDTRTVPFFSALARDTTGTIYSSMRNGDQTPEALNAYFYLKNKKVTKSEFAEKLVLKEKVTGKNVKIAFNWLNDSLVNIFNSEKLDLKKDYEFSAPLNSIDGKINYLLSFRTSSEKEVSNVIIDLKGNYLSSSKIKFLLINTANIFIRYAGEITTPGISDSANAKSSVQIKNVPAGDYKLFAYDDANDNDKYDYGVLDPFEFAEKFSYSKAPLKIQRGESDIVIELEVK